MVTDEDTDFVPAPGFCSYAMALTVAPLIAADFAVAVNLSFTSFFEVAVAFLLLPDRFVFVSTVMNFRPVCIPKAFCFKAFA